MTKRSLFLLGGTGALTAMTPEWLNRAGGNAARLVILACGPGWQTYMPIYTQLWRAQDVQYVGPDASGKLNLQAASIAIAQASAVFVAGGDTELYQAFYGIGPMRELLRQRYAAGIPYAGCSAGALLAMETCVLYPPDSSDIRLLKGLGLLPSTLIGVHFSDDGGLSAFLPVIQAVPTNHIWGIDDDACALFENEVFLGGLGGSVHALNSTQAGEQ
jgi:cyanophycinase